MKVPQALVDHHRLRAQEARESYLQNMALGAEAKDWDDIKLEARSTVMQTLRASNLLTDVKSALKETGSHLFVFRRLLAPAMSQDRFRLICPSYSKSAENNGTPLSDNAAGDVAAVVLQWLDPRITRWVQKNRRPTIREIRTIIETGSMLITAQSAATVRRTMLAKKQETAAIEVLRARAWEQRYASLIVQPSQLLAKQFMHKTRFAAGSSSQEVDIACGLGNGVILAMECKVTNDETNSVKRINDILKKAGAWQSHWGSFVKTAALLQGVIAYKDVHHLLEIGVEVFWSHRLSEFGDWIDANTQT